MTSDDLILTRDGAVATLTINRPDKRNAMKLQMWAEFRRLLDDLGDARALIVTGSGDHFCAGADIGEFAETRSTPERAEHYRVTVDEAEVRLSQLEIPVIAAIRGNCIGGGLEIALACDLRIASGEAKFGITAAKLGIVYGVGGTRRLVTAVGSMWAKYVLLTGEIFDVPRAQAMGLLTDVVSDPVASARELAEILAARSPYTQRAAKTVIDQFAQVESLDGPDLTEIADAAIESDFYQQAVAKFNRKN